MERIGPYEVEERLGAGGVGVVFRARDPEGRPVAVKVLHQTRPDAVRRFARERDALALLRERDALALLYGRRGAPASEARALVVQRTPGGEARTEVELSGLHPTSRERLVVFRRGARLAPRRQSLGLGPRRGRARGLAAAAAGGARRAPRARHGRRVLLRRDLARARPRGAPRPVTGAASV